MKRYNIDTQNGDLIQIDLNDSWTIQENEEALLNLVRFEGPETKKRYATVIVTKSDLINLRDNLNRILDGIAIETKTYGLG
jgi:hypothetical protein